MEHCARICRTASLLIQKEENIPKEKHLKERLLYNSGL